MISCYIAMGEERRKESYLCLGCSERRDWIYGLGHTLKWWYLKKTEKWREMPLFLRKLAEKLWRVEDCRNLSIQRKERKIVVPDVSLDNFNSTPKVVGARVCVCEWYVSWGKGGCRRNHSEREKRREKLKNKCIFCAGLRQEIDGGWNKGRWLQDWRLKRKDVDIFTWEMLWTERLWGTVKGWKGRKEICVEESVERSVSVWCDKPY